MFDDWSNGRIIFGLGALCIIALSVFYQFSTTDSDVSGLENIKRWILP